MCTSDQQCPASRWQFQKHLFESAAAIRECIAQVLDVNVGRDACINSVLLCHCDCRLLGVGVKIEEYYMWW